MKLNLTLEPLTVDVYNPGGTGGGGLIISTPFGDGSWQNINGQGSSAANADGSTGWSTNGIWTILQRWINFPNNNYCTFTVPAYGSTVASPPGNSIQIEVDQLQIPYTGGNITTNFWFCGFATNTSPSQNYVFGNPSGYGVVPGVPVTSGWHSVVVAMASAAYTGYNPLQSVNSPSMHMDRLIVTDTGVSIPTEPNGNRDATKFPLSSYHFWNTPFGQSATFVANASISGSGGNGASLGMNISSFSTNIWYGYPGHPTFSLYSYDNSYNPTATVGLRFPVLCPPGMYCSGATDQEMVAIDTTNPRFRYNSGEGATYTLPSAATPTGFPQWGAGPLFVTDNYNLNHSAPQGSMGSAGIITQYDLESGVIAHRILGGLGFAPGGTGPNAKITGYAPGTQVSDIAGMVWPGSASDYNWTGVYTNPNGVPYASVIAIPPGTTPPSSISNSPGGLMIWNAIMNYGIYLNISVGFYPGITIYGDGASISGTLLSQINAAFSTIVPYLKVMNNPAPIIPGHGFGGGPPVVSLLPGLAPGVTASGPGVINGYPSLGLPPYTFPSPNNVLIPTMAGGRSENLASSNPGSLQGQQQQAIPIGSFVFLSYWADAPGSCQYNTASDTAGGSPGNAYTIIQPAGSSATQQIGFAYCLKTTVATTTSTAWTVTQTPGVGYWIVTGVFFIPSVNSPSLRSSNTSSGSASSFSLSTTANAGDLVIAMTGFTSAGCGLFNEPSGWLTLTGSNGIYHMDYMLPSSGPAIYNPSWDSTQSGPYQGIIAAFSGLP